MKYEKRVVKSFNQSLLVGSSIFLLYFIFSGYKIARYVSYVWLIMFILMILVALLNIHFKIRKIRLENLKSFYNHLWESNQYIEGKGLCINLKIGKIELQEDELSRFLVLKDKKGYVLSIPFFKWFIDLDSEDIPFQLKRKLFKRPIRRRSELKTREIFKILTQDEKKKVLHPILFEVGLVVVYYFIYSLMKSNIVGLDTSVTSLFNLILYFEVLYCIRRLFTELTNNEIFYQPGIGLPKVDGETYIYHTKGMVVKLSSENVKIRYDEKLGILFTDIGNFRYARKMHRLVYRDFKELNQKTE